MTATELSRSERDTPQPPTSDQPAYPGPSWTVIAIVVGVAIAVAAAVVLTVGVTSRSHTSALDNARATVLPAAARGTTAALSYNYQHLSTDFAAAEALMTAGFRANYAKTTAGSVRPLATKYHAVSTATVVASGVDTLSTTRATVLVFVDQTVTNSQLKAPRLDRSRVEVTLVNSHGRWLINNLSPI